MVSRCSRKLGELPLQPLYKHTLPVQVLRGTKDSPRLFVSGAIHGDELNGTEIIRQLLKRSTLKRLRGTLLLVPMVNVYGFLQHSR